MPRNFIRSAWQMMASAPRFNEAAADAAEFSLLPTCKHFAMICFNEAAADAAEFYLDRAAAWISPPKLQ